MNNNTIIDEYTRLLRDVVNSIVEQVAEPFLQNIISRLGFQNPDGWHLLCSCMDLMDDTEFAKQNFLRFYVSGPTKCDDIGESYLRLYGILNAIWLQKSAVQELGELFKICNKSKYNKVLNDADIIQARNMVGSHTVNFRDPTIDKKRAFMLIRIELEMGKVRILDTDYNSQEFDLLRLIKESDLLIVDYLDAVLFQAIRTIHKTDPQRKTQFMERLGMLRDLRKGITRIELPNGGVLIQ